MTSTVQPALFISHGAPTLALEDSPTSRFLSKLAQQLDRPRAIVVVSAHWETPEAQISIDIAPKTIHDFGGFPHELYALTYPAQTDLDLVDTVVTQIEAAGINIKRVSGRGLDHGAWTPLLRMYPDADIPVVNLSLPRSLGEAGLRKMGRALRVLREDNVLIIASGSYTHNLWQLAAEGSTTPSWARSFSSWIDARLSAREDSVLDDWIRDAPAARTNHPSDEHFLPLFVALGAASDGVAPIKLHDDWRYGSLSMACWRFD